MVCQELWHRHPTQSPVQKQLYWIIISCTLRSSNFSTSGGDSKNGELIKCNWAAPPPYSPGHNCPAVVAATGPASESTVSTRGLSLSDHLKYIDFGLMTQRSSTSHTWMANGEHHGEAHHCKCGTLSQGCSNELTFNLEEAINIDTP